MERNRALMVCMLMISAMLPAQSSYLNRPERLHLVDSCLKHTYNFSFHSARQYQQILDKQDPEHPAPPFLKAMIIYWENFPLSPDNPASEQFVGLMELSVERAALMLENDSTYLEGVFFDLFGRAFKAMFWADNGKSGKVISDLGTMYSRTKEGFELQDQFSEFYFSSGLYNYTIETYPEAHPIYKPLVAFMHEGNRDLGLEQLEHAIDHTTFLKVESLLFMSLIQLHHENDLQKAAFYAERLHRSYPRNIYYQGHLIVILLHLNDYDRAEEIIRQMDGQQDNYSKMIRQMATASFTERRGDDEEAEKLYLSTISMADSMKPFTNIIQAIGFMGLSRLHERKGQNDDARRYARKARDFTSYSFIIGE